MKINWRGVMNFYCLLIIVGGMTVVNAGPGYAGNITLLAPPQNESILMSRNKIVDLVVKVDDPKDLDSLYLQSEKTERAYDPTGRYEKGGAYYVHYSVRLKKGVNDFTLEPVHLPIKIRYTPLSSLLSLDLEADIYLFHKKEVIPAECKGCHGGEASKAGKKTIKVALGQSSPECYSCHKSIVDAPESKHFPAAAMLCRTCHYSELPRTEVSIPSGRIEEVCFACHINKKDWLSMKHVHGPVGTGDCTICHDPHGSNSDFQLWTDGKAKLCVVCHEDKKKLVSEGAEDRMNVHGILSARGCVVCHSPHATEYRFQLLDGIRSLCVSCHSELADTERGHPVAGHPLSGVEDPLRPGNDLICTSCHNPHGSKYVYMLPADTRGGLVCAKCHSGQIRQKPQKPSWYGGR